MTRFQTARDSFPFVPHAESSWLDSLRAALRGARLVSIGHQQALDQALLAATVLASSVLETEEVQLLDHRIKTLHLALQRAMAALDKTTEFGVLRELAWLDQLTFLARLALHPYGTPRFLRELRPILELELLDPDGLLDLRYALNHLLNQSFSTSEYQRLVRLRGEEPLLPEQQRLISVLQLVYGAHLMTPEQIVGTEVAPTLQLRAQSKAFREHLPALHAAGRVLVTPLDLLGLRLQAERGAEYVQQWASAPARTDEFGREPLDGYRQQALAVSLGLCYPLLREAFNLPALWTILGAAEFARFTEVMTAHLSEQGSREIEALQAVFDDFLGWTQAPAQLLSETLPDGFWRALPMTEQIRMSPRLNPELSYAFEGGQVLTFSARSGSSAFLANRWLPSSRVPAILA